MAFSSTTSHQSIYVCRVSRPACRLGVRNEALAEIRAYPGGLQALVAGVFDHLDGLIGEFRAEELARQQNQRQAEQQALQGQIDRLAAVAADLAKSVAEQKRSTTPKNHNGR